MPAGSAVSLSSGDRRSRGFVSLRNGGGLARETGRHHSLVAILENPIGKFLLPCPPLHPEVRRLETEGGVTAGRGI